MSSVVSDATENGDSVHSEKPNQSPLDAGGVSTMTRLFVKDISDRHLVHEVYLARDKAVLTGKNGKPYISLYLSDKTGAIDARIWDNVDSLQETFQSGDLVRVKGQVQLFQNRKQLVVHRIEKVAFEQATIGDFINSSKRSPEEMLQQLLHFVEGIQDGNIRLLVQNTLNDPEIRPRLLQAPAAKSIHHAYFGGLLEHILSICGLMQFLAGHYPGLSLDHLIFGAIFHDIGKIWELDIDGGISYTDKGKLLGHMMMAVELVEKKASRILGFSEETKTLLKHIILSHHGKLEYGSPKPPMFLEAFIVAAIDDLDSKINTIQSFVAAERESGETWSKFHPLFDRSFYLKA